MIIRSFLFSTLFLSAVPAAAAQTIGGAAAPSPAPAAQPLGGPVVPGVCLLSREAVFANAAVGKAASARLADLTRTAQADVDAQRQSLEGQAKALEGQADKPQIREQRASLAARWQELQLQAAHVGREIDATRTKALERIATEAQPVIAEAYAAKKCGLLLDRSGTLGGNFANDLTPDVVRLLDGRIQTISFERERLAKPEPAAVAPAQR